MNIAGSANKVYLFALPIFTFPPLPTAFSADRTGAPQVGIVLLQRGDVLGVHAAVGVGLDRHLIEIVGAPALERHQLPHRPQVHMEHIAVQSHLPHIGPHVADARLGHPCPNQRQLLLGHHHMKVDRAAAFLRHRAISPLS